MTWAVGIVDFTTKEDVVKVRLVKRRRAMSLTIASGLIFIVCAIVVAIGYYQESKDGNHNH